MTKKYTMFALAAVVYMAFAAYLYRPYFKGFDTLRLQDLIVANICLASLGTYVLSRRWVAGFAESFFAGAIYGFGPFALGLAKFHPTAGFLVAAIPWLFCPAVFGPEGKFKPLRILLSLLPFLSIVLFFQVSARFGLYPIPIKLKLHGADLAGLLAPLVAAKRHKMLVGFYHVPIAALVMGLCMFAAPLETLRTGGILHKGRLLTAMAARRFGIVIIFAVATILAFCDSFGQISPIIWLAISMLCCSVLIGVGMQGLISAGPADRRWILLTAILLGILAIITLLFATKYFQTAAGLGAGYARLLTETAKMYILGAIAIAMLFVIARAKLRIHPVRQILLYAAMALDIFLGARFIVDTIL
ncbi:MAG: hypothetical protein WBC05_14255 [Sedimentisphaerales bacterium]